MDRQKILFGALTVHAYPQLVDSTRSYRATVFKYWMSRGSWEKMPHFVIVNPYKRLSATDRPNWFPSHFMDLCSPDGFIDAQYCSGIQDVHFWDIFRPVVAQQNPFRVQPAVVHEPSADA